MGILRRVLMLIRGYAVTAGETIDRLAEEEARREARARKEAFEELRGAESALPTAAERAGAVRDGAAASDAPAADYALLGLRPGTDLSVVEATWRELARRADPKRFPPGSEEEKRAAELLRKINEAYARIREHVNPTEGRFGKLEL